MAEQPNVLELPNTAGLANDDFSVANRFKADHGATARYCKKLRNWFIWDGKCWCADETDSQIHLARETIEKMREDAAKIPDQKTSLATLAKVNSCRSAKKVNAALQMVRSEDPIAVMTKQLDRSDWMLTCKNVTIDLRTGAPGPHDPAHLITKLAPVTYNAGALYPNWRDFLSETYRGNEEIIGFVRRWAGYCLTGSTSEHVMVFCYGTGANGKSVLMNTFRRVLGSYSAGVWPEALLANTMGGDKHPADIAQMRGCRLVTTSEPDPGKKVSESRLKILVGSDKISARRMGKDWFEFIPTHKLMLASNHKPSIKSTDPGTWRRILLLPFENTIPTERRDKELENKLWLEASGILNWMLLGLREYLNGGLQVPLVLLDAADEYRQEQDMLGHFVATMDKPTLANTARSQATPLYEDYKAWCTEEGMRHPLTLTKFGTLMKERADMVHDTDSDGRVWYARKRL